MKHILCTLVVITAVQGFALCASTTEPGPDDRSARSGELLDNDKLMEALEKGMAPEVVNAKMDNAQCHFDDSMEALVKIKEAGNVAKGIGALKPGKPYGPPRKKWDPKLAAPTFADRMVWRLVIFATGMAMLLLFVIVWMTMRSGTAENTVVKLGDEYRDPVNNYSIHPPNNWALNDPHDGRNFYILGTRERGFSPVIMICLDIQPGDLDAYLKDYTSKLEHQEKTVKWLSNTRDRVDATESQRLEYECDVPGDDGKAVKVRSLQYIIPDPPRFYRVTCSVRSDLFERYQQRFEASARSFKRTPINAPQYNILQPK